jgi:hypothetical protein
MVLSGCGRRRRRRRPHPSNIGLQLWRPLEPSLLKLGPPPLARAVRLMSAAKRRKQLANKGAIHSLATTVESNDWVESVARRRPN